MSLQEPDLSDVGRRELLALARASIDAALPHGVMTAPPPLPLTPALAALRASFVTLRIDHELRGCCGTIEPQRSLAEDVWRNAWASAFADPRFPPLTLAEWPRVDVHVSVLTPPAPMGVSDELDLLRQLRPRIDGLVLELDGARATFLPAVWDQIEDPERFVQQLKMKAGWPPEFWSSAIRVSRYQAEDFGEE
jgi:AmmeMemoRadiSam system protein A